MHKRKFNKLVADVQSIKQNFDVYNSWSLFDLFRNIDMFHFIESLTTIALLKTSFKIWTRPSNPRQQPKSSWSRQGVHLHETDESIEMYLCIM